MSVFTELRLPQTQIAADALKIQNLPPSLESVVTRTLMPVPSALRSICGRPIPATRLLIDFTQVGVPFVPVVFLHSETTRGHMLQLLSAG